VLASHKRFRTSAELVRLVSGAIFIAFGLGKFTDHASEMRSFADLRGTWHPEKRPKPPRGEQRSEQRRPQRVWIRRKCR